MTKFQELNNLARYVDSERRTIERRELAAINTLTTGLRMFLECPPERYVVLNIEADNAIDEVSETKSVIRNSQNWLISAVKIVLDSIEFTIHLRVKWNGKGHEVKCFGATALVDIDDSHTHVSFYGSVFDRLKEHIEGKLVGGTLVLEDADSDDMHADTVRAA